MNPPPLHSSLSTFAPLFSRPDTQQGSAIITREPPSLTFIAPGGHLLGVPLLIGCIDIDLVNLSATGLAMASACSIFNVNETL